MPERSNGGWYPPDDGPSPADRYIAWLDDNGYEDTPERQAEFAGDEAGLEELLGEDWRAQSDATVFGSSIDFIWPMNDADDD